MFARISLTVTRPPSCGSNEIRGEQLMARRAGPKGMAALPHRVFMGFIEGLALSIRLRFGAGNVFCGSCFDIPISRRFSFGNAASSAACTSTDCFRHWAMVSRPIPASAITLSLSMIPSGPGGP